MTQSYVKTTVPGIEVPVDKTRRAVRLHHPTLRSCIWTIQQLSRIYPIPFDCPMCGVTHIYKTIHLNLDAQGNVTVSEPLYQMFKEEGIVGELKAMKEVVPRPFAIGMPTIDASPQTLHGTPEPAPPQPPTVFSREEGAVKVENLLRAKEQDSG